MKGKKGKGWRGEQRKTQEKRGEERRKRKGNEKKKKRKEIKERICEKENERDKKEKSSLHVGFIHSAAWIQSSQVT